MKVKLWLYEYSGAPKNVAADCEVAITDMATANVDMWFLEMKKSRDDSIFVRLSITEVTVITKK